MSKRTFRMFVEEELGEFPHFVVGAILEWFLIASLFMDGFIAFLSHQFATIFQLDPPCVLCTRIDQSLAATNPGSYYNNSICESHKKDISSLAYCHVHRKLSDIRNMCDGCLISFQTDKESNSLDPKNHPVEEKASTKGSDPEMKLKQVKTGKETNANTNNRVAEMSKCSCCGESFKKRTSSKVFVRTPSNLRASLTAPAFSPRVPLTPMGWRNDEAKNVELSQMRYTELKFVSDSDPDMPEDDYGLNTDSKTVKDDMKSTTAPDNEELTDESLKTPTYGKGNKFFGAPLAESAVANSPRFGNKLTKKFPLERPDLVSDLSDDTPVEGDSTRQVLKRQIRSDKRMLMVLYQELNAERNASAVAANNSMAMITRLQAEKASIEMEALQYQRMMEEQAEYDDEAIQILKDMLIQKEKDIKVMEAELETYREKYGEIKKKEGNEFVGDSDYRETESEKKRSNFETERYQISGMLNNLENLIQSSSDDGGHEDKDRGEKKATLEREMSIIKEKMSVIEADSGYLKNTTMTLQHGDERADLFTEIAQNLRKLRT